MQSATSTTLPETPLNDVTAGIDWAVDDHAACIVDGRGREIARVMVEHTTTGLRDLVIFLAKHGVDEVAIERPDGPIIDVLLEAAGGAGGEGGAPARRRIWKIGLRAKFISARATRPGSSKSV